MEPQFWQNRWRNGQIGFHQSSVDRNLRRHWPALNLGTARRVFVPLCGKSLDLLWLREQGHFVTGVEFGHRLPVGAQERRGQGIGDLDADGRRQR